jgi:hypothetical protein
MSRTIQHGNGLSTTLWGSFGRLALGIVLSVALCIGISFVLGAGCGGQKEDAANTVKETASAPVATTTQTSVPVTETTATPPAVVEQPTVTEQPVVTEKPVVTTKKTVTTTPVVTQKPAPVAVSVAPVVPKEVVLAVGTILQSTLENTVSSDKSTVGDAVTLRTTQAVVVGTRTVVPVGSAVHGRVTHVRAAGRLKGAAELTVRFTELELPTGERVAITCDPLRRAEKGDGRETATEIGAGAVVGGALGGVLGGKDDVLKGAAVGAVLGTGVAGVTKGQQIVLPAGQTVKVTLAAPVTLTTTGDS